MKAILKYILAPAAVALTLSSCFETTPDADDPALVASVDKAMTANVRTASCEYENRKTMSTVVRETGVIMMMRTERDSKPTYMIEIPHRAQRYMMCNMPAELQREGMRVIFSGDVKEVYRYERWPGIPFKLTEIRSAGS